jgi:hypothetical protein
MGVFRKNPTNFIQEECKATADASESRSTSLGGKDAASGSNAPRRHQWQKLCSTIRVGISTKHTGEKKPEQYANS